MLHEVILSLSGHPCALFDSSATIVPSTSARLLSTPEGELLSSIGTLSRLHRRTRDHATSISHSHASVICRAVATAIVEEQLEAFQRKILDVEQKMLEGDAATVGAYNIVPLAGIVSEFSGWMTVMDWLWNLCTFVSPLMDDRPGYIPASGASIIDKLRSEAQTGYAEIERAARHLSIVAETSWLRQLSTWLLHGRLPAFGAPDFFVQHDGAESVRPTFVLVDKLLPKFVSSQTASSILFVGKSLNQISSLPPTSKASYDPSKSTEVDILSEHVARLASVTAPVATAKLSEAVMQIRISLSRNLLQHLLPRAKILDILLVLKDFFLLGRGEFAVILVAEADSIISLRRGQADRGMLLKENEMNQMLMRSLSTLSALSTEDDYVDGLSDVAAQLLHFRGSYHSTGDPIRTRDRARSSFSQSSQSPFDDLLLSVPALLGMDVRSPLDLLISDADMQTYSALNSYLLACRRAHLHLTQLWRQTPLRRDYPCPPGYTSSNSAHGKETLRRRRFKCARRAREMRKVWATCAASVFFLSESEEYFQGSVIGQSFQHFLSWVNRSRDSLPERGHNDSVDASGPQLDHGAWQQYDPEILALAHRQHLSSVTHALLLTDSIFTKTLRTFCTHVDELVAHTTRLTVVQQDQDLEEDEGLQGYSKALDGEEDEVKRELDRARRRLDSDLKALIERLREIDEERASNPYQATFKTIAGATRGSYEPLALEGVNRLLIKLDWYYIDSETIS